MSNVPFETNQADADAPASEPLRKPKKTAKTVKKAKATKRATKTSAAQSTKKSGDKPAAERNNKKAEVIAMMKRSKGANADATPSSAPAISLSVSSFCAKFPGEASPSSVVLRLRLRRWCPALGSTARTF